MRFEEIDKNFAKEHNLTNENIKVYDVCEAPFSVHGLILPKSEDDRFRRMPPEAAEKVSRRVFDLHTITAGGRVRFKTDSNYMAIVAKMPSIAKMSEFAVAGGAGFDLYTEVDGKQHYVKTFIPPFGITDGYKSEAYLPNPEMREYTINFPYYSNVSSLKVVLSSDAEVLPPRKYKTDVPVVYYGSSITQGACASRPGNCYEAVISRALDCDFINLGFSGNAIGEPAIAEYISTLKMSAFVYDYDYNSRSPEELSATHKPMFDIIRKANPDLPIICVSAPITNIFQDRDSRREVIEATVNEAKAAGDKNVYFIDGRDFGKLAFSYDNITIDGTHPNDLGFDCMAKIIGEKLAEILN